MHLLRASRLLYGVTQPFCHHETALSLGTMPSCSTCNFSTFGLFSKIYSHSGDTMPGPRPQFPYAPSHQVGVGCSPSCQSKPSQSLQTFRRFSSHPTHPGEGSNVGLCLLPSTVKALDTSRS